MSSFTSASVLAKKSARRLQDELWTVDKLKQFAQDTVDCARQQGADACAVDVSSGKGFHLRGRMGAIEGLTHRDDRHLSVTVYRGKQVGHASTNQLTSIAMIETVAKAVSIAKLTAEDAYALLPDKERLAKSLPDLDLYHPSPLSIQEARLLTERCESAGRAVDPRITNSEGVEVGTRELHWVVANSDGLLQGYARTRYDLSCSLVAESSAGKEIDHWYTSARNYSALESTESVGRKAAERVLSILDSQQLETMRVPVVFPAELARSLFASLVDAVSGGNLYRQTSFLLGTLGQTLFPSFITIRDEPHLLSALGSAPMDDEGVATKARTLVGDGVLEGYVLSSYSARKLGMETTGNAGGIHNLVVSANAGDAKSLLKQMGRGLYLRRLMGDGVNTVTGDFSFGASGFWVENGEIQYPVSEITVAGNLREMFQHIVAVGNDIDTRSSIRCGSVLIAEMMVAGR